MAQIVFRTSGFSKTYANTTSESPFALSSGVKKVYINTANNDPLTKTPTVVVGNFVTNLNDPVVKTPLNYIVYAKTADPNQVKDLVLKIGTVTTNTDYTFITIPDATGEYNPLTNTGGYNVLPAPYDPERPYRENVRLWTLYRIWDVYGETVQFPESQAQQDLDPYSYDLFFPTKTNDDGKEEIIRGIYEIILIAAPYFNEKLSGGSYDDDDTGLYNIVNGLEGVDFTVLNEDDYLYAVSGLTGALEKIEQVDKVFTSTRLNLKGLQEYNPSTGYRLYGSAAEITGMANSNGNVAFVDPYTENAFYAITASTGAFQSTNFAYNDYVYYKDPVTKNYVLVGRVLEAVSETVLNVKDLTDQLPSVTDYVLKSATEVTDFNYSGGTFASASGSTIFGTNTTFTLFEPGQTLYFSDQTLQVTMPIGVIDTIVSDTEITLTTPVFVVITAGDDLYASDNIAIDIQTSLGLFTSISAEQSYYVLKGDGTEFQTQFAVGDYIYIVNNVFGIYQYTYELLGQPDIIPSETEMIFYSPNNIEITSGDWIWGNPAALVLINPDGRFDNFENGTYYSVIGSGTNFVNNFTKGQYLFYLDSPKNVYVNMGQIFEIYDATHVWMLDPVGGNPAAGEILVSSWTLNTETANYEDYKGKENIVEIAEQFPGWYIDTVGIMIDDNVNNCLNGKRYEFLKGVMCGRCNQDYLSFYAIYVAMVSAIEIQEWDNAIGFYNQLKQICLEDSDVSCGC